MAGELVPFEGQEDKGYDEQIRDALEKALNIHGTTLSDLQDAMNCILQMGRAMQMCGVPNPYDAVANGLIAKYKMDRREGDKFEQDARKLLERPALHPIEIVGPKAELVHSEDGQ